MVCVPCIIIPVLLYIWHRFIQPIVLRYWNPWQKKDAEGNVIQAGPEFPFQCKGGVCPYVPGGANKEQAAAGNDTEAETASTTAAAAATTTTTEAAASGDTKKQI